MIFFRAATIKAFAAGLFFGLVIDISLFLVSFSAPMLASIYLGPFYLTYAEAGPFGDTFPLIPNMFYYALFWVVAYSRYKSFGVLLYVFHIGSFLFIQIFIKDSGQAINFIGFFSYVGSLWNFHSQPGSFWGLGFWFVWWLPFFILSYIYFCKLFRKS